VTTWSSGQTCTDARVLASVKYAYEAAAGAAWAIAADATTDGWEMHLAHTGVSTPYSADHLPE